MRRDEEKPCLLRATVSIYFNFLSSFDPVSMQVPGAAKDTSASQLGGLLKQGSRALGSLLKQGSQDVGGAAPGSPSRQPDAMARQSVQSGASDGPGGRALSSTSAGGGKTRALQRSAAMTKEKVRA